VIYYEHLNKWPRRDTSKDKTMIGTGDHPIPEAGSIEETMSFEVRNDHRRYYPIIEVERFGGEIDIKDFCH
jgi:hypothetical protein